MQTPNHVLSYLCLIFRLGILSTHQGKVISFKKCWIRKKEQFTKAEKMHPWVSGQTSLICGKWPVRFQTFLRGSAGQESIESSIDSFWPEAAPLGWFFFFKARLGLLRGRCFCCQRARLLNSTRLAHHSPGPRIILQLGLLHSHVLLHALPETVSGRAFGRISRCGFLGLWDAALHFSLRTTSYNSITISSQMRLFAFFLLQLVVMTSQRVFQRALAHMTSNTGSRPSEV